MKPRIIMSVLTALLIMSLVGCPNESQSESNTSSNNKITSLQTVINTSSDGDTINLSEYADITDYNATVNKALTITSSETTSLSGASLTVSVSGVEISSISDASVTASSSLGNGSLKISSSSLSGLTINGGGISSIVLDDVTVTDVTIDKASSDNTSDQYIRLCVNATTITNLNVSSSALIDTTDNSCDANAINITFSDNDANLNVAFRKTIEFETPNGKVKADFAMGGDDNSSDFYIIVNENAKIAQNFYRQVSNKMANRDIDGQAMPIYNGEESFEFDRAISSDMTFRMERPKYTSLAGAIEFEAGNQTDSVITVDLSNYPDITDYTVTISQALILDGADRDFNNATLTVSAGNVTLKNVNNASVTTNPESAVTGSLTVKDCSMGSITVSGYPLDVLDISDTTVDNLAIQQITGETLTTGIMKVYIGGEIVINNSISLCRDIYIDALGDNSVTLPLPASASFGDSCSIIMSSKVSVSEDDSSNVSSHNQVTFVDDNNDKLFSIWVKSRGTVSKDMFMTLLGIAGKSFNEGYDALSLTASVTEKVTTFTLGTTIVSQSMTVTVSISELPTVLFDFITSEDTGAMTYSIYMTDNPASKGEAVLTGSQTNSFCFDNLGTLYVLYRTDAETISTTIWQLSGGTNSNFSVSGVALESIAYDHSTDTLYGKADGSTVSKIEYNTNSALWTATDYSLTLSSGSDTGAGLLSPSECFAVNNGTVYLTDGVSALYSADLNSADEESVALTQLTGDLTKDISCSNDAEITDINYQDGCVYMLLRETNWQSGTFTAGGSISSCGAVIKYSCFDQSVEAIGWSDNKIEQASISKMYLYHTSNDICYSDENLNNYAMVDATGDWSSNSKCSSVFPTIYGNGIGSCNEINLYGPVKFVGLKPKKLVIADDGLAFYTDDNNAVSFKNVNQIVTVDLESFALDATAETDAEFYGDLSYLHCNQQNNDGSFYWSGTLYNGSNSSDSKDNSYIGIRCADSLD